MTPHEPYITHAFLLFRKTISKVYLHADAAKTRRLKTPPHRRNNNAKNNLWSIKHLIFNALAAIKGHYLSPKKASLSKSSMTYL